MEIEGLSPAAVLGELAAIGFAKVPDMVQVSGGELLVCDTAKLTPTQAAAVERIEKGPGGLKIKFYDKLKALELLGKALGAFDGSCREKEDSGLLRAIVEAATAAGVENPSETSES